MAISILKTKIYVPVRHPDTVARPRLLEKLQDALEHKLTLVSAPAGFGKTTILSEWINQCSRPAAWVSLDEGDNDPVRFLSYVIAALQTITGNGGSNSGDSVLTGLQSTRRPDMKDILTGMINDITETYPPFILVLDDFHIITSPEINEILVFLLDHLPPQMHLVLSSRADPPWSLARLRVRRQMIELRAQDLRFTINEVTIFLNEVMGLDLSPEEITSLETRTEGWIAGLQMAALSMREKQDVSAFIRSFSGSHHYILDYLMEEVLEQQPREVQDFLLKTAVLERMRASLCEVVTGQKESQALLTHIENANLFLIPLDEKRLWFRYHHLFRDLLMQRMRQDGQGLEAELHRRASRWYREEGLFTEAVNHILAAGDYEQAGDLIEQTGWEAFTRGEMAAILGWMAALPADLIRDRPQLSLLHAWAVAKSGDLDGVELCLQDLVPDCMKGEADAVRAYVAGVKGNVPRAVNLARNALDHLPEDNLFLRAIVTQNLGVAYHWQGDPDSASHYLTQAIHLSRRANQPFQELTAIAILGRAYEMRGSLHRALDIYQEGLEVASGWGSRPAPFVGMVYVGKARLLYEWNDLASALQDAKKGLKLSKLGGFVAYQIFAYALLSQIYRAMGQVEDAENLLQKGEQLGRGSEYDLVVALVTELRISRWIDEGNIAAASRWGEAHTLRSGEDLDAAKEIEQITAARVLLAQGFPEKALVLLDVLLQAARSANRMDSVLKMKILQALAYQAQKKDQDGLSALEHALSLAEPEGYLQIFIDHGEAMERLLRRAISEGVPSNYTARLLAAFAGEREESLSPLIPKLDEPLTGREIEVLRLVVAGLSNAEIAEELVIALSTVKTHINHIYHKMDVSSRTRAAAKARELDLL